MLANCCFCFADQLPDQHSEQHLRVEGKAMQQMDVNNAGLKHVRYCTDTVPEDFAPSLEQPNTVNATEL